MVMLLTLQRQILLLHSRPTAARFARAMLQSFAAEAIEYRITSGQALLFGRLNIQLAMQWASINTVRALIITLSQNFASVASHSCPQSSRLS